MNPKLLCFPETGVAAGLAPIGKPVATDETDRLIASDKVAGTAVFDARGQRLGAVYNFMVDKVSGQVAYAVISFGGFLGLGERFFPLPWKALSYDPALGGYVVDLDKSTLESGPSYAAGDQPWSNPDYGRDVHGHYGINPGL